jgi:hypothetical protein
VGDVLHDFEFDELVGEQPQGPPRATFGRTAATQGDELGLGFAVDDSQSRRASGRLADQRRLQAFLDEPASDAAHRVDRDFESRGDRFIRQVRFAPGLIGMQQDSGMRKFPGRSLAGANQA